MTQIQTGFIYNVTNGHYHYIGQTTTPLEVRFGAHRQTAERLMGGSTNPKDDSRLYRTMVKYGIQNFHIEFLMEVDAQYLDEEEVDTIAKYRKLYGKERVLNETLGGNSPGRGEFHTMAKLTDQECEEIKARRGENQRDLAEEYGVTQGTISRIQTGSRRSSENDHPPETDRSLWHGGIGLPQQREMFLESQYHNEEQGLPVVDLCLKYYGENTPSRRKMVREVLRKFRGGYHDNRSWS